MSTYLYYNGVEMRDCETRDFMQTVEYDQSRTDRLLTRIRLTVASTMVKGPSQELTVDDDSSFVRTPASDRKSVPHRMISVRGRLLEPRGDFFLEYPGVIQVDGNALSNVIIACGNPNGVIQFPYFPDWIGAQYKTIQREWYLDAENGPKPISVKFENILGGNSVRVIFEIEICLATYNENLVNPLEYPAGYSAGAIQPAIAPARVQPTDPMNRLSINTVLSNRWSMRERRGADWAIQREIRGVLRVRHQSYFAHGMRYLCMPGLQKNFQRQSVDFSDDPTGLNLEYQIIDVQREAAPPYPAVDWTCKHGTSADESGNTITSVSVMMRGPPGVNKEELIYSAIWAVTQRVPNMLDIKQADPRGQIVPRKVVLLNQAIVNDVADPVIEYHAAFLEDIYDKKHFGSLVGRVGAPMPLTWKNQNDEIVYCRDRWPSPLPFGGDNPVNIFACYLQNPASIWHGIPKPISPVSPNVSGSATS